jgi:hypothetical protein
MLEKDSIMEQQNVVVTQPTFTDIQTALDHARNAIVSNGVKTGELLKTYSKALDNAFDVTLANGEKVKWFNLTGKQKSGVKAEYDKFVVALKENKLEGNKYVYWQRIKEFSGYVTAGNKANGNKTLDDKTKADLMTIINRIVEDTNGGGESKSSEILEDLRFCFTHVGGDLTGKGMK